MNKRTLSVLAGLFVSASAAFALDDVVYGPVFTFTSKAIQAETPIDNEGLDLFPDEWKKHRNTSGAILWKIQNQYFKRYKGLGGGGHMADGPRMHWFSLVSRDGIRVGGEQTEEGLRFWMTRMTVEEARRWKGRIQRDIFDLAKTYGLEPGQTGRVNIGLRPFFADPLLLRNFIVHYDKQEAYRAVFEELDSQIVAAIPGSEEAKELTRRLVAAIVEKGASATDRIVIFGADDPSKPIDEKWLIMMHGHQAQRSAEEWTQIVEKYEAQIQALHETSKKKELLPL